MKTTEQGRLAEQAVADKLQKEGYKLVAKNWRTPRCEIDLIISKGKIVHFVEVKYRAGSAQGDGFEYITPRKLAQMRFAARVWIAENDWSGDWRLLAAAVSGPAAESIEIIEI